MLCLQGLRRFSGLLTVVLADLLAIRQSPREAGAQRWSRKEGKIIGEAIKEK